MNRKTYGGSFFHHWEGADFHYFHHAQRVVTWDGLFMKQNQDNEPPELLSSDEAVVKQVLEGNIDSFEVLVTRYQKRVFASVRRYVKREADVQDVAQSIFIKAFQKLGTWRAEAPFSHWISKMTLLTCYDYLRRQQRSHEVPFAQLSDLERDWLRNFMSAPQDIHSESLAAKELLQKAMGMLSASSRIVLDLFEIQDKTCKEVSELTGWSLPLVKVRAFRARHELKKILIKLLKNGIICPLLMLGFF